MKIAVLGTGSVGSTIADKLIQLGHLVMMGSRTATNEKALAWASAAGSNASVGTFADAAAFGELIFNCTKGLVSLEALKLAGAENMNGKTLLDVTNSLDFSTGLPTLGVANTDSLGEQIQREFPDVKVVKTLNTVNCKVMVNPNLIAGGDHNIFVSGNHADAKEQAKQLLTSFGWRNDLIIDLGDITTARGAEQYVSLWIRLAGKLGTSLIQMKLVK